MACLFRRVAVGQRFRELQGASAPRAGKECHITVYCCRPTKRSPRVIRREREAPAFSRKEFPFLCSSSRLRVYVSPDRLSSIFPVFPRPSGVSLSTNDLKRCSSCIKDTLRDALTFSRWFFFLSPRLNFTERRVLVRLITLRLVKVSRFFKDATVSEN